MEPALGTTGQGSPQHVRPSLAPTSNRNVYCLVPSITLAQKPSTCRLQRQVLRQGRPPAITPARRVSACQVTLHNAPSAMENQTCCLTLSIPFCRQQSALATTLPVPVPALGVTARYTARCTC